MLAQYSYINTNIGLGNNYKKIRVKINKKCNCDDVKSYLIAMNKDNETFTATPVFYTSDNDPDSYWILESQVLTQNNEDVISESNFIDYAETMGLELIESKYSMLYFKVKEVKTGFESLEIANRIYESGKAQYAHPNFIVEIVLF